MVLKNACFRVQGGTILKYTMFDFKVVMSYEKRKPSVNQQINKNKALKRETITVDSGEKVIGFLKCNLTYRSL